MNCKKYVAPEIRYKTSSNPDFKAADVWALGMTFAYILNTGYIFNYNDHSQLYR